MEIQKARTSINFSGFLCTCINQIQVDGAGVSQVHIAWPISREVGGIQVSDNDDPQSRLQASESADHNDDSRCGRPRNLSARHDPSSPMDKIAT